MVQPMCHGALVCHEMSAEASQEFGAHWLKTADELSRFYGSVSRTTACSNELSVLAEEEVQFVTTELP